MSVVITEEHRAEVIEIMTRIGYASPEKEIDEIIERAKDFLNKEKFIPTFIEPAYIVYSDEGLDNYNLKFYFSPEYLLKKHQCKCKGGCGSMIPSYISD